MDSPLAPFGREPAETAGEDSEESLDAVLRAHGRAAVPLRRLRCSLAAAAALLAAAAFCALCVGWGSAGSVGHAAQHLDKPAGLMEAAEDPAAAHPCRGFPNLLITGVKHNNLGGHGPSVGKEGLTFYATDKTDPFHKTALLLELNALSPYTPHTPRMNGMVGRYGNINVNPDTHVKLRFSLKDFKGRPVKLDDMAITFFDLDQGSNNTSSESVCAEGFHRKHITKRTEVRVKEEEDGTTCFKASTFGTGFDNPRDPQKLSVQQINRAVSFIYKGASSMEFTIAVSKGSSPRFFTFAGRPSVLCANVWQDGKIISHGGCPRQSLSALLALCLLRLLL